MNVTGVFQD